MLDLRTVFVREDRAFTPWLSQAENLGRLSRALGFGMRLEAVEVMTGTFRTDILATNVDDGTTVVIENQFGRSDHDHFGKAMTYLAAHDAKTVIWIAETFVDEHRAALTWLNDNTPEDIRFFCIAPRLMRIGNSPPGLRFDVVIGPNVLVKRVKQADRKRDQALTEVRGLFWSRFDEMLEIDDALSTCTLRYGGRAGHRWIIPSVGTGWQDDEPHVLVFVSILATGRQTVGVDLRCRSGARAEAEDRRLQAIRRCEDRSILFEQIPADFSTPESMRAAAAELVKRARVACDELQRVFVRAVPVAPEHAIPGGLQSKR